MIRISSTGKVAYGSVQVSVDGEVPGPLAIRSVQFPSWRSATQLIYQDGAGGAGPWQLNQLTYPGLTQATLSATGAAKVDGGDGIWAKWLPGEGVTTNASGVGPFPDAMLGCVSDEGHVVVITDAATMTGLIVYDSDGDVVYQDDKVRIAEPDNVCLRSERLSYLDVLGKWHIINIATGQPAAWARRIEPVNWMVPVLIGTTLYVLERTDTLTLREAKRNQIWFLRGAPDCYMADAIAFSPGIRAASCQNAGLTTESLNVYDVTLPMKSDGSVEIAVGSVVGGAIVYGPDIDIAPVAINTFPVEGVEDALAIVPPYRSAIAEKRPGPDGSPAGGAQKLFTTWEWLQFFEQLMRKIDQLQGIQRNSAQPIPPTPSAAGAGFNEIRSTGQPPILSQPSNRILTIESADGTVTITLNPATNTIDLAVTAGGPAGPDTAVQFKDGAAFGGQAEFVYNKLTSLLRIIRKSFGGGTDVLALNPDGTAAGEATISLDPGAAGAADSGYQQIGLGLENYVATDGLPAYLWKNLTDIFQGFGMEGLVGEVVGDPLAYNLGVGFSFEITNSDGVPWVFRVYEYGTGLGADQPGLAVWIERNTSGAGAAGSLLLEDRDGNKYAIWVDATGTPRIGPARPTADDSVSDTSGTPLAGGFPNATYLTDADETADLPNSRRLLAGTNVSFDDSVPGERTINASGGGSSAGQVLAIMRLLGDGATTVFNLLDYAEWIVQAAIAGAVVDPFEYSLISDGGQIEFDAAPGDGDVIALQYVLAQM